MGKRIVLIEDETLAAERIRRLLSEVDPAATIIGEANSVRSAIDWLNANRDVDLILADIELKDGQVFEVFQAVDVFSPVVFITSYDEYTLQAFKVNCLDYLLKPVRKEELKACLQKYEAVQNDYLKKNVNVVSLLEQLKQPVTSRSRFLIRQGSKYIPIEIKEVAYFYAEGRYTYLKTWEGKNWIVDHTLEELEKMVDPQFFFRANRGFFIHANAVKQMVKDFTGRLRLELQPSFPEEVYISKERSAEFKRWLDR